MCAYIYIYIYTAVLSGDRTPMPIMRRLTAIIVLAKLRNFGSQESHTHTAIRLQMVSGVPAAFRKFPGASDAQHMPARPQENRDDANAPKAASALVTI